MGCLIMSKKKPVIRRTIPTTQDEAWENYQQNGAWFDYHEKPRPTTFRLSRAEWLKKYGNDYWPDRE